MQSVPVAFLCPLHIPWVPVYIFLPVVGAKSPDCSPCLGLLECLKQFVAGSDLFCRFDKVDDRKSGVYVYESHVVSIVLE